MDFKTCCEPDKDGVFKRFTFRGVEDYVPYQGYEFVGFDVHCGTCWKILGRISRYEAEDILAAAVDA